MRSVLLVSLCFLLAPFVKAQLTKPETYADFWPSGAARTVRETVRDLDGEVASHGLFQSFHENGQLSVRGRYENDVRQGVWEWFREDGSKLGECRYEDGVGPFTAYFPDGSRLRAGTYRDDVREGLWTEWYPSGAKRMEGPYVDDQQHGTWTYWRDGASQPEFTIQWNHGERVE